MPQIIHLQPQYIQNQREYSDKGWFTRFEPRLSNASMTTPLQRVNSESRELVRSTYNMIKVFDRDDKSRRLNIFVDFKRDMFYFGRNYPKSSDPKYHGKPRVRKAGSASTASLMTEFENARTVLLDLKVLRASCYRKTFKHDKYQSLVFDESGKALTTILEVMAAFPMLETLFFVCNEQCAKFSSHYKLLDLAEAPEYASWQARQSVPCKPWIPLVLAELERSTGRRIKIELKFFTPAPNKPVSETFTSAHCNYCVKNGK